MYRDNRLNQLPIGSLIKFARNDSLYFVKQPDGFWRRNRDGQCYPHSSFRGYDMELTSELEILSKTLEQTCD